MHIALNVNVQVKDGTLVLTDRAGKTVTFSKEQTVVYLLAADKSSRLTC